MATILPPSLPTAEPLSSEPTISLAVYPGSGASLDVERCWLLWHLVNGDIGPSAGSIGHWLLSLWWGQKEQVLAKEGSYTYYELLISGAYFFFSWLFELLRTAWNYDHIFHRREFRCRGIRYLPLVTLVHFGDRIWAPGSWLWRRNSIWHPL